MDNNTSASGSGSGTRSTEQPAQNNPSSSSPPAVTNPTGGNFLDELLSYTPGINELPPITPPSSGSGESDSDVPENLLCSICNRRENSVLFVVCGHRACTSCTKRLWNSMRNQPGKPRDPWPISFPCPFCRGVVVSVRDDSRRADKQTGARRAGGARKDEQGMLVAEWILLVSDKAKERLEAEMKGEAPFTDEDFM